jgi:hypothetical protein
MPIPIICGACGHKGDVPDEAAGRTVQCPKCKATLPVPAPAGLTATSQGIGPLPVQVVAHERPSSLPGCLAGLVVTVVILMVGGLVFVGSCAYVSKDLASGSARRSREAAKRAEASRAAKLAAVDRSFLVDHKASDYKGTARGGYNQVRVIIKGGPHPKSKLGSLARVLVHEHKYYGNTYVQFFNDARALEGWDGRALVPKEVNAYWVCDFAVEGSRARFVKIGFDRDTGQQRTELVTDE